MAKKSSKKDNEEIIETQSKKKSKTKEPLVSTKKKVGIAIYFTFLATLAGVMGVQMLVQNNTMSTPAPTTQDTYSTNIEDTTPPTPSADTYSNFPIDERAPKNKVATPFELDNTSPVQEDTINNNELVLNEFAPTVAGEENQEIEPNALSQ